MKPEEFRKQKERYEKLKKRQITDEEFERLLRKPRKKIKWWILEWWIPLIIGLAIAAEWPGRWLEPFGRFSSYLGWFIVVLSVVELIQNLVKKEGVFFKRE